jgi:hypothetical protein
LGALQAIGRSRERVSRQNATGTSFCTQVAIITWSSCRHAASGLDGLEPEGPGLEGLDPEGLEPEGPELDGPGAPPMFGQTCVGAVVGVLDDEDDLLWPVLPVVAALATVYPIPMLSPKAPPAIARVMSGLLSLIIGSFLLMIISLS